MAEPALHRKEDRRLLTGRGRYLADLVRPGTAHVALLRSPLAHARIRAIDVAAAAAHPGVLAVVTQADLEGHVQRLHHHLPMLPGLRQLHWPLLADGKVRFAGEPVVAVVATSRAVAEDAADLVRLDLEPLPPLTSIDEALADGAPLVYDDWTDNVLLRLEVAHGDAASAIDGGTHPVLRRRIVHHRVTGAPLEGHGALADHDPGTGRLTLHASSQSPHFLRTVVAEALGMPESRLRVVAPDIGGAFGNKGHYLREEILIAALARRLDRPVVWSQDRIEGMTAGIHSRQQVHDIEIAHRPDGRIVAMRAHLRADLGSAELYALGMAPAFATAGTLPSVYDIQDYAFVVEGVVTNKAPSGGYRGYGQPQAVLSMERIVDLLADQLGLDPMFVRRANLIPDGVRPYVTAGGSRLDVGPLSEQLDELLAAGGYDELRKRQAAERAAGRLVGIGVGQMVETTAANPHALAGQFGGYEMATVTVHPDGHVSAMVGTTSHGQGHETVYAKLVADTLTVSPDVVDVREGDTDAVAYGAGTWGSRSAVMGGGALLLAAERVRAKMIAFAADMLHQPAEAVTLSDGALRAGDVVLPLSMVANLATLHAFAAPSVEPGLSASAVFEPGNTQAFPDEQGKLNMAATHSSGAGLALVEVDAATGRVRVREATILHDCGRIIDRIIVEGQIQGGFAQGLGAVLLEAVEYGPDGAPLVRTLQDYPMPTTREVPVVRVLHQETPSELPGGFRGMGESAAILAPAMIANAVHDALRPLGVPIAQSDLRPPAVRDLLRAGGVGLDLDALAQGALAELPDGRT